MSIQICGYKNVDTTNVDTNTFDASKLDANASHRPTIRPKERDFSIF